MKAKSRCKRKFSKCVKAKGRGGGEKKNRRGGGGGEKKGAESSLVEEKC